MCVKIDCFDFKVTRQGHAEMDMLCQAESVSSVDACRYDQDNTLPAKGSGTQHLKKPSEFQRIEILNSLPAP